MVFLKIIRIAVLLPFILVAAATGYLLALATLALPRPKKRPLVATGQRFTILVPAHNEELLIGQTLANLQALDYDPTLYRICLVADNCTDRTAEIARQSGVAVYERFDTEKRGKGYALEWLLGQLFQPGQSDLHEAFVFVDADSRLSANFLQVMAAELANGAEIVQAYYGAANPDESWRSALRYVALAAINYARPMGRQRLGLSVGLKGNGMVFAGPVLRELGWPAYSRAEDTEMHARLLLAGRRVSFTPDCQVWGVMAATAQQARTQEMRWEGGRLALARQYIPRFWQALPGRPLGQQAALVDSAVEITIPPVSLVAGAGVVGTGLGWLVGWRSLRRLGILTLAELGLYIGFSLVAARVPLKVYRALPLAPLFVIWKIWLYLYTILKGRQENWIRTPRN